MLLKYVLSIVLIFMFFGSLQAQLVADAGTVVHICANDSTPHFLGSNQTANGGNPPYTYEWSITPIPTLVSSIPYLYASDLLSDTTVANPKVISTHEEETLVYLKVTDANGLEAFDTAAITFSYMAITLGGPMQYFMEEGDTIHLIPFEPDTSDYGISSMYITPSTGLSNDSAHAPFYATPAVTTGYTTHLTDKYGCEFTWPEETFIIHVFPLSVNELNKSNFSLFPNPTNNGLIQVKDNSKQAIQNINVFDITGKKLNVNVQQNIIDLSLFANGLYIVEVETELGIERHKVLKE